jgi:hypothetical protein
MSESTYKRLTRDRIPRQFAVITASRLSLWLGNDHLLLVESNGFTESYKRFYFRDIQAITVQETTRRKVWNAVLAVPLAICLIGLLASGVPTANVAAMVTWSIFVVILAVPFTVNNIRGTACACQLRTAVQTEDLGSLSRVRQAQKVLNKIRPLIAGAQGQLTAAEVSAHMHQAASGGVTAAGNPEPPASSAPPILS